jgi:hypothetical protein
VNQCGLVANRTIRAEGQSEDAFEWRLRSSFGYAVAVIWIMTMDGLRAPSSGSGDYCGTGQYHPDLGIALGVLGVSVVKRSADKRLG